jgi:hypothetical protein
MTSSRSPAILLFGLLSCACGPDHRPAPQPPAQPCAPLAAQAGSAAPIATSEPAPNERPPAAPADPPAAAAPPTSAPSPASSAAPVTLPPLAAAIDHHADIRGLCNLDSNFPDDHACIPAPPVGEGMQIHIGPKNYDDPAEIAKYVMHPGDESSECFAIITPNDEPIYYQTSVLSGRAGTHHIINTMFPAAAGQQALGKCTEQGLSSPSSIGAAPGASKPYMPRGTVAPEYAHVGSKIPAHAKIESDMHYFNSTEHDILREFWLNIYFAKAEDITEESKGIAALGGFGWNLTPIQPGTDNVYAYSCPIRGDGYLLSLLGHYHAHGKRFTASLTRASGVTEKVFEMYDYMEPAQFEYNSIVQNPTFSAMSAGAITGRLAVHDGDILNWECHIVNDSKVALTYTNEVKTGEMCNLWGSSLGVDPIVCAWQ